MQNIKKCFLRFLLLMSILFMVGCVSGKGRLDKNIPAWAVSTYSDPNYYQGVGYAAKVKKSILHYEEAQKSALKALSEAISVEISATSNLITIEKNNTVYDDFTSIIQARSKADISGAEKCDSYENKNGYWVLYRLSKQVYLQQQREKRDKAVKKATEFFVSAKDAQEKNDVRNAIIQYAKTLDAVKDYFDETVEIDCCGINVNLISEAYNQINTLLNNLKIELNVNSLSCRMGQSLSSDQLGCCVTFDGKPVARFPVQVEYFGLKRTLNTDSSGKAGLDLTMNTEKEIEQVVFSIDKNTLLLQSAADYVIRKWLMQIPSSIKTLYIRMKKPEICIDAEELNMYKQQKNNSLQTCIEGMMSERGFSFAECNIADYLLEIKADTKPKTAANGIYSSILTAIFTLKNIKTDKTVYFKSLTTSGTQLNFSLAGEKAYAEAVRQIEIRIFGELNDAILNDK